MQGVYKGVMTHFVFDFGKVPVLHRKKSHTYSHLKKRHLNNIITILRKSEELPMPQNNRVTISAQRPYCLRNCKSIKDQICALNLADSKVL